MKKIIGLLTVLLLLCSAAGVVHAEPDISDYNGKRLGVLTGPLMEDTARKFFPDSEVLLFNTYPDCIAALLSGKVDAYLSDEAGLESVHAEQPQIDYIHERLAENNYSFAFRKNDPESAALCEELNAFLARCQEDGTIQELEDIWFGEEEDRKLVDMSGLTGENGTVRVVTTSTDMPFSYIKNGKNVGYDIDIVVRFCRDRGYALELGDVDFAGRIPAIQSGKYDFTTDMNVTPEREEEVLFSDPTSKGGIVLAVLASDLADSSTDSAAGPAGAAGIPAAGPEETSTELVGDADVTAAPASGSGDASTGPARDFSDLAGKKIAVQTGTISGEVATAIVPDLKVEYFNTQTDCLSALRAGKVDAWCTDDPIIRFYVMQNPDIEVYGKLDESDLAAVFPKTSEGQALCDQYNAFVDELWADGTMSEIDEIWFGTDESRRTVLDYEALPDTNGTLRMAVDPSMLPFTYVKDNRMVGYDVDIAARFCQANGYRLDVVSMDFSGVLPSVQTGKCDFASTGITVTEERKESVLFSHPNYKSGTALAVMKKDQGAEMTFWDSIRASFDKTFLREDRWKLFADGVLVTLLITLLSLLAGTALGFVIFLVCRNGNRAANLITRFCLWLVQGMPVVVLLMILYYVVFGNISINGAAVAVIGFTFIFGASVFGLLKMGVGAVDPGQYEAAYALGYSNSRTFFRIILPQALPHVLPAYRGEVVSLIKATAVVGYIAVQDLTKMGDIVRSRTYEAFFPLIAVTVIYFLLEGLLGFLVSRISIQFNPKRRKADTILKGVKIND